jgi:hypothetical protein
MGTKDLDRQGTRIVRSQLIGIALPDDISGNSVAHLTCSNEKSA